MLRNTDYTGVIIVMLRIGTITFLTIFKKISTIVYIVKSKNAFHACTLQYYAVTKVIRLKQTDCFTLYNFV